MSMLRKPYILYLAYTVHYKLQYMCFWTYYIYIYIFFYVQQALEIASAYIATTWTIATAKIKLLCEEQLSK